VRVAQRERERRKPLQPEQWYSGQDSAGASRNFDAILEKVRLRGVATCLKPQLWPYLLQLYDPASSGVERAEQHRVLATDYAQLLENCEKLDSDIIDEVGEGGILMPSAMQSSPAKPDLDRLAIMNFEESQRIIVMDAVRTEMGALASLEAQSRGDAGGCAAGGGGGDAPPPPPPGAMVWNGRLAREMLAASEHLSPYARRAAARLISLLSAYAVYDPEIGYCQGMADLAAPFVALVPDDVEAFWCFERLMRHSRANFAHSGEGVRAQLRMLGRVLEHKDPVLMHHLRHVGAGECLFAYRMVLVLMRRELSLANCLLLWEMLWAEDLSAERAKQAAMEARVAAAAGRDAAANGTPPRSPGATTPPYRDPDTAEPSLLVCFMAAVIHQQRRRVLDDSRGVDDVLRLFSSYHIALWRCLRDARLIRASFIQATAGSP